ncbi:MAG: sigma-54-dependent Fis family transcriptional regulator [Desulfobacterales bacterium]|nr:sigma-54-dependent Fis family transcriptional regulator [Desulfobacterales bacterium]
MMNSDSIHVLIVEDEQVVCSGCRLALTEVGYAVDIRMTGETGLDAALEGSYDLVLLDVNLPDMGGMEILRKIREKRPDVHVIVMTGFSTVQNAVEAMKLGAFDYLAKPFSDGELVLAMEKGMEKKRLMEENQSLRKALFDRFTFGNIVGNNPEIIKIFDKIEKVARTDSTVLVMGESGTGKELFAGAIYARSQRAAKPFVAVDCSTLAPTLLESELFGHVKGAFTGAVQKKAGIFEAARGGTLFLDDVTNLTMEIQGKLLRVLEMQEYKPVGADIFAKTDVRIIAATNQDLRKLVDDGRFRNDLYYRINVFPIYLPPLRERRDDIPHLAYHFLKQFCKKTGKRIEGFSDDALDMLVNYHWPGNIRQLKNVIERLVIMADSSILDLLYIVDNLRLKRSWGQTSVPDTLEELKKMKKKLLDESFRQIEKAFIAKAIAASDGNVTRAAERVGMQRSNFSALIKKHGLSGKKIKQQ